MKEYVCDLDTLQQLSYRVVEASPDAMIVINEEGVVVIFNVQAELLFGYERGSVIGNKLELLIDEPVRTTHEEHRKKYFDFPGIREMGAGRSLLGLHRNGKTFPVQIKLAPLIVSSGIHALAVVRRLQGG